MAICGADSVENEPQSAENEVVCFSICFSPSNSSVAAVRFHYSVAVVRFHCSVAAVHLITAVQQPCI